MIWSWNKKQEQYRYNPGGVKFIISATTKNFFSEQKLQNNMHEDLLKEVIFWDPINVRADACQKG